jgi:hypothetical protein
MSNVGKPAIAWNEITQKKEVIGTIAWDGAAPNPFDHTKGALFSQEVPSYQEDGRRKDNFVAMRPLILTEEEQEIEEKKEEEQQSRVVCSRSLSYVRVSADSQPSAPPSES